MGSQNFSPFTKLRLIEGYIFDYLLHFIKYSGMVFRLN